MVNVAEKTLNEVDVVLWLVEPSNFIGAGEQHIVEQLKKVQTPVILVINKVDTVEKIRCWSLSIPTVRFMILRRLFRLPPFADRMWMT